MYRRDSQMGPWTDIYAIGACIYACMQGFPPTKRRSASEKTAFAGIDQAARCVPDNLIEVVEWCMALTRSRARNRCLPAKGTEPEGERRYTKLSVAEKMRLQLDTLVSDTKKTCRRWVKPPASEPSPMNTIHAKRVCGANGLH